MGNPRAQALPAQAGRTAAASVRLRTDRRRADRTVSIAGALAAQFPPALASNAGEWVIYATHRQHRTFLPDAGYDPLAPGDDAEQPTELPAGNWQVAVFDNLFLALSAMAHAPPQIEVQTRPGLGACEVVVFTQDGGGSLGQLSVRHIGLLIEVWAERYRELGAREDVQYVFAFENRGAAVGTTLHHPHGQIYAYPFPPPVPARELEMQRRHFAVHGRGLLEAIIAEELRDRDRLLYAGERAVAFDTVPEEKAAELRAVEVDLD